ncbi:MAG: ankyrin repeat domain-containing protein [Oligoflexia bacterium]|nr:ankyrin repeat domain-containing protein [Oligoflexia bacterium]
MSILRKKMIKMKMIKTFILTWIIIICIANFAKASEESSGPSSEGISTDKDSVFVLAARNGQTKIIAAAFNGDEKVVNQLIAAGADLDIGDKDGETALMNAVFTGHLEIVKSLVNNGADVDIKDNNGRIANDYSSTFYKSGYHYREKILEEYKGSFRIDPQTKHNLDLIQKFLSAPKNEIKRMNQSKDSGLFNRLIKGEREFSDIVNEKYRFKRVKEWIEELEKSNNKEKISKFLNENVGWFGNKKPALLRAAKKGRNDIVEFLIEKGANVDAVDGRGKNAIEIALEHGHVDTAAILTRKSRKSAEKECVVSSEKIFSLQALKEMERLLDVKEKLKQEKLNDSRTYFQGVKESNLNFDKFAKEHQHYLSIGKIPKEGETSSAFVTTRPAATVVEVGMIAKEDEASARKDLQRLQIKSLPLPPLHFPILSAPRPQIKLPLL